jgi:hypothetical protein
MMRPSFVLLRIEPNGQPRMVEPGKSIGYMAGLTGTNNV